MNGKFVIGAVGFVGGRLTFLVLSPATTTDEVLDGRCPAEISLQLTSPSPVLPFPRQVDVRPYQRFAC